MRRGGVDLDRAPQKAVEMLIEANTPEEDDPKMRVRERTMRKKSEGATAVRPDMAGQRVVGQKYTRNKL